MSLVILCKNMNFSKINDVVSYILIVVLWSPHATKECVEICNGPVFVSPALLAMMTPFVQMDMSAHGFLMQLLWSPFFILPMFLLFKMRDHKKYGKYFQLYIVRWMLFTLVLVVLYNLLFWGGLRTYTFPSFIF